ncbi:MAG: hypothetical protein J6K58_14195 [Lachnospiraceae bacterium]|nr:hypothetical protein [Lachnospiraceae bacterium]
MKEISSCTEYAGVERVKISCEIWLDRNELDWIIKETREAILKDKLVGLSADDMISGCLGAYLYDLKSKNNGILK